MAEKKRILIVDDDFEIALFLRTTLEIVSPDYEVINVPSGEEGMLELYRGIDLVISDLNLPGVSGLNLIKKMRQRSASMPIIVITGDRSTQLHQEAQEMGLSGFFLKPVPVDELTALARRILDGEFPPEAPPAAASPTLPLEALRRLKTLRVDTGALYAMLVDLNGNCLIEDGQVGDISRDTVAGLLAKGLMNSFELARALKAPQPFTINYQAGAEHDLYAANVGANYSLALIFDSRRGRSQIGAVWVYARRAVKDMLSLLANLAPSPPVTPSPAPAPRLKVIEPLTEAAPAPLAEETPVEPTIPEPAAAEEAALEAAAEPIIEPIEMDNAFSSEEVHAFWDSVLGGDDEPSGSEGFGGISLEEARAQGLIPADFDS